MSRCLLTLAWRCEIGRGICAVFLRGAGLADVQPQVLALLVLGSLTFGLGLLRFRKQMD